MYTDYQIEAHLLAGHSFETVSPDPRKAGLTGEPQQTPAAPPAYLAADAHLPSDARKQPDEPLA
jgi:hypothetical protein